MSQIKNITKHLESGKSITAIQALKLYGCFRLAARIHDIRAKGIDVISKTIRVGDADIAKYSVTSK
jgi:hypothetical protein